MKHLSFVHALSIAASALLVSPAALAGQITSAGDPALAGSQVVDFEFLGNGVISTNFKFDVGNVTFWTGCFLGCNTAVATLWVGSYASAGWANPGNALHTRFGNQDSIYVSLKNGNKMQAIGFDLLSAERPFGLAIVDDLGQVTTINRPGQAFPYTGYYGFAFDDPARSISEVRLRSTNNEWQWMMMDNFRYVVAATPVPEPGTSLLLGVGVSWLIWLRRSLFRRNRA